MRGRVKGGGKKGGEVEWLGMGDRSFVLLGFLPLKDGRVGDFQFWLKLSLGMVSFESPIRVDCRVDSIAATVQYSQSTSFTPRQCLQ